MLHWHIHSILWGSFAHKATIISLSAGGHDVTLIFQSVLKEAWNISENGWLWLGWCVIFLPHFHRLLKNLENIFFFFFSRIFSYSFLLFFQATNVWEHEQSWCLNVTEGFCSRFLFLITKIKDCATPPSSPHLMKMRQHVYNFKLRSASTT